MSGAGVPPLGALSLLALPVPELLRIRCRAQGCGPSREDRRPALPERAGHIGIYLEHRREAV